MTVWREVHAAVVAKGERGLCPACRGAIARGRRWLSRFVESRNGASACRCGAPPASWCSQRNAFRGAQDSLGASDQLGDFVGVLEFRAIDFDDGRGLAKQDSAAASTMRVLPEPVARGTQVAKPGDPGNSVRR